MKKHTQYYDKIRILRKQGLTYSEINKQLGLAIPASTYSFICKDVVMEDAVVQQRLAAQRERLAILRKKAVARNRAIFTERLVAYQEKYSTLTTFMKGDEAKLIALAMLYLGEGAKWQGRRGPMLGSSNVQILQMYISLLHDCFGVAKGNLRCRIQHRADQDSATLLDYWSKALGIPPTNFYLSYIDKRTIGHKTRKPDYKGVCSVTCAGTHIQLELQTIADIIGRAI